MSTYIEYVYIEGWILSINSINNVMFSTDTSNYSMKEVIHLGVL